MAYVEPQTVFAPRTSVRAVDVICNTGPDGWSVARINWEGSEAIGIRWNGGDGPGIGNPQSRGNATWFIVPKPLQAAILEVAEELALREPGGLLEKYREMADDQAREAEAEGWSEGLIGDLAT